MEAGVRGGDAGLSLPGKWIHSSEPVSSSVSWGDNPALGVGVRYLKSIPQLLAGGGAGDMVGSQSRRYLKSFQKEQLGALTPDTHHLQGPVSVRVLEQGDLGLLWGCPALWACS